MKQSSLVESGNLTSPDFHVAIIMDGNGRWAAKRGLPRTIGHRAGATAVRRTVEAAVEYGISTMTLYAFSADNWKRPTSEVSELMKLFRFHLLKEAQACVKQGIRLSVIGRRDRLPGAVRMAIETAEVLTRSGTELHLRLAIDYSARETLLQAARKIHRREISREEFGLLLNPDITAPDVDLLIRTSGEQRLSDFLLWECAYAELSFTATLWPDFGRQDLLDAVHQFHARNRRFGGIEAARTA